jgi:SmpA / OmlA family
VPGIGGKELRARAANELRRKEVRPRRTIFVQVFTPDVASARAGRIGRARRVVRRMHLESGDGGSPRMRRLTGVGIAGLLFACAHVGTNFDANSLAWLREGTPKDQIRQRLGEPLRVGSDGGIPTWTYGYYEYRLFGESNNKDLVIRFSPDAKVMSYALSTTFREEKEKLDPAAR